jgi:ribosomal protein S18 acetylase RimI-like enzyme
MLRTTGLRYIFYAGDEDTDTWLLPALRQTGYTIDTTVVVYEKHDFSVPDEGNTQIALRPARADDLPALVELDTLCFEAHWTKDETLLHEALTERGLFAVALAGEQIVGYAYATTHFGGRLVHLVRIAVHPQQRRHGIGARLLAAVVHYSREQQADLITLNTQSYNERAQQLYRWFGFVRNGEYQTVLRHNL